MPEPEALGPIFESTRVNFVALFLFNEGWPNLLQRRPPSPLLAEVPVSLRCLHSSDRFPSLASFVDLATLLSSGHMCMHAELSNRSSHDQFIYLFIYIYRKPTSPCNISFPPTSSSTGCCADSPCRWHLFSCLFICSAAISSMCPVALAFT